MQSLSSAHSIWAFALVEYLPPGDNSLTCDETVCCRFPVSLVPLLKYSSSHSVPSNRQTFPEILGGSTAFEEVQAGCFRE